MPAKKFLRNVSGTITEVVGVVTSAGAANDGDIPVLDATGKLDVTLMPSGIGADTAVIQTSEALVAGDFVNIWDNAGSFRIRKADATTGKEAHGFVLAGFASGANATVYFEGTNNQVSGQTPGVKFLSTTAGQATATAPNAPGNIVQRLGIATTTTSINFQLHTHIVLA